MRLCVPISCFFKITCPDDMVRAIEKIRELGFDAVEAYDWRNFDLDGIKKAVDNTGVEFISIMTTESRLTSPEYSDLWVEGIKNTCEAASKIGAHRIISQVGNDTGASRESQHNAIVETLIKAAPILNSYNITAMIEPLNVKVNHPGYYLTSSAEAFDIIREVNDPCVKIVYDIYHQQITEGDIIPSVTKNLDCITHLHSAGHPGRHELQNGELNYKFIFDAIDDAGYTGSCGLEYRPLTDPIESLKEAKKLFG